MLLLPLPLLLPLLLLPPLLLPLPLLYYSPWYVRNHGSTYLCEACMAKTTGPLIYTDFREAAPHRLTCIDHDTYLRTTARSEWSPWTQVADWNIFLQRDDPQHILFNAGVASDVVGSAIASLIHDGHWGAESTEVICEKLYKNFVESKYGALDAHFPKPFSARRLGLGGNCWPRVAPGYKHGQVRAFLHWAPSLTAPHVESELGALRHLCVASLSGWVELLDKADVVLTQRQQDAAMMLGRKFFDSFGVLHEHAKHADLWLWGVRPKFHQLDHTMRHVHQSKLNPLWWSCWMEEDLMGRSAKITRRVHASFAGLKRALTRYKMFLHCEFICQQQ